METATARQIAYKSVPAAVLHMQPVRTEQVEVEVSAFSRHLKRASDIFISSILIVGLFIWIFPFIALFIIVSSKGPVFFRQRRVGYGNHIFHCLKFRTMYVNELSDFKEAHPKDERITPAGKWLRRLYIDELPQVFNVFRGEMSIVGPRPHMVLHHQKFSSFIPLYEQRHKVKPGITGLAQIKGYHGHIADQFQIHGRTKLDLFYVKKASLWLDFKIMFCTFLLVARLNKGG